MAFPSSPTNGQQATVGNVIYQYTTATNSWTKILGSVGDFSAVGNITGGNVISLGLVTAVGNLSGAYVLGNGSQLTGLPEQYGNANVAAYLPTYTGNIGAGNITASTGNITGGNLSGNLNCRNTDNRSTTQHYQLRYIKQPDNNRAHELYRQS
jgi:hypothetical protein